jgi:molybdate transport system ATP-binding protein
MYGTIRKTAPIAVTSAYAKGAAGPIPLDAELSCGEGQLLALIGPSGSGKTTILRAIAGLYRPREGRITCGGVVWFDAAEGINDLPHKRPVGLVFQSYALFTALRNVMAALGHRPARERKAEARALLALVHLQDFEDRRPASISCSSCNRLVRSVMLTIGRLQA